MIQTINFAPGDLIRVYQKIREGDKTRVQVFEGTVIDISGRGENKMFTARKVVDEVAVERIWPIKSPSIEKVVIKEKPKNRIRRAKLYHLRKKE